MTTGVSNIGTSAWVHCTINEFTQRSFGAM